MPRIFNRTSEKDKRRNLRTNAPNAERLVWARLQRKQVLGYKFRRQYSIGPYVIDFYCPALKLAVEIDGDSHLQDGSPANDGDRQAAIEAMGIRFLRFTNQQVFDGQEHILAEITMAAADGRGPTPL